MSVAGASQFDVAIVGASAAGCTAAILYGRAGARVALVERAPSVDAYKRVCTHYIQRSAVPTLARLGLVDEIERAGGIPNHTDLWTRWGWITLQDSGHGYNIRRRTLDPILRRMAAVTPGVELLSGQTAVAVLGNGRPGGVEVRDSAGTHRKLRARLTVAADGRGSELARLAHVPGRVRPHGRFLYWGYFSGLRLPDYPRSKFWMLDPDTSALFPNDGGLAILGCFVSNDRLPEFRRDPDKSMREFVRSLPDAPAIDDATLEGKVMGKLDMTNVSRPAAIPGIAFVGDAALATDPLWGVGCGFAYQSAEWLVQQTASALLTGSEPELDAALAEYRRQHRRELGPHHFMIADYATGRPFNPIERALFSGAAHDRQVASALEEFASRSASPARLFHPDALPRAALLGSRTRLKSRPNRSSRNQPV